MSPRSLVRSRVRGLYALTDADTTADPVAHGLRLLDAGVRLLQLRCKSWDRAEVLRAARVLAVRSRALGATFLVNDHCDVAREAGADGAHVGQTDLDPVAARRLLGEDLILGRSTGSPDEIDAALEGADYLAFGPVFETPHLSRPKPVRGLEGLRRARARVPSGVPLVAIGGIRADRLDLVRGAGADAWAVLGALAVPDPTSAAAELR